MWPRHILEIKSNVRRYFPSSFSDFRELFIGIYAVNLDDLIGPMTIIPLEAGFKEADLDILYRARTPEDGVQALTVYMKQMDREMVHHSAIVDNALEVRKH